MPRIPRNRRPPPAAVTDAIRRLGANIALARIHRRWRQEDLASKAGVDRRVVVSIEAGEPGVTIASYVAALWALGLHRDVADLASAERDLEGQTLARSRVGRRVRVPTELDDDF